MLADVGRCARRRVSPTVFDLSYAQAPPHSALVRRAGIDLIEHTKEYCFLVTPYFKPWPILDRALTNARQRGTRITFIVRRDTDNFAEMVSRVDGYEAELIALTRLHTKLYLNERSAIVSSMNLYDSSNENNFELGVLWEERQFVRQLKDTVLDKELLFTKPELVLPGWFTADETAKAGRMAEFKSALESKGFCVQCGTQTGLYLGPTLDSVYRVRCTACWSEDRDPENPHRYAIRFCHICGSDHRSTLDEPFHAHCRTELVECLAWEQGPAGKYQLADRERAGV